MQGVGRRWLATGLLPLALSACGHVVPPSRTPPPRHRPAPPPTPRPTSAPRPTPTPAPAPAPATDNAAATGISPGPAITDLSLDRVQAERALAAFRLSCPSLVRRTDGSGLTRPEDWQPACAAAASTDPRDARGFFGQYFEAVQVGDGRAFATGYYVPEIRGSRTPSADYAVPIYGRPRDLIDVDLGAFSDTLKGKHVRGRVEGTSLVPYPDRAAIETGAIDRAAPVLAWAADPVEVFFLQVQGSGLLRTPDGEILRLGYDSQNGRDYTGIGALMRQRGLLAPGQGSMQGISAWLHDHPEEGRAIMRENKSYVFFRFLSGPPLGALGIAVTGGVSAAVDPKFVPLGAPILLMTDRPEANRLWIAQDTGGAIKGANRVDTFWGAGVEATMIAGGMSARGTAYVLLPAGALARLRGRAASGRGDDGASIIP